MASNSQVKQRIEEKYEHDDQVDEIGNDYAGQLTILFCANDAVSAIYGGIN